MDLWERSVQAQVNKNSEPDSFTGHPISDQVVTSLLKIIKDANAPLYLYDDIMKWASDSVQAGFQFSRDNIFSRRSIMKKLFKKLMLENLRPRVVRIRGPSCNKILKFSSFSWLEIFDSLLSDPDLMTADNLLIDKHKPCEGGNYDADLNDIESSTWFQQTHRNHHMKPDDLIIGVNVF